MRTVVLGTEPADRARPRGRPGREALAGQLGVEATPSAPGGDADASAARARGRPRRAKRSRAAPRQPGEGAARHPGRAAGAPQPGEQERVQDAAALAGRAIGVVKSCGAGRRSFRRCRPSRRSTARAAPKRPDAAVRAADGDGHAGRDRGARAFEVGMVPPGSMGREDGRQALDRDSGSGERSADHSLRETSKRSV